MTAVRIARGATGRNKIVKFAGCYHGHLDALLVAGRQRRRDVRAAGFGGRHRGNRRRHDRRALQRPRRARRPCSRPMPARSPLCWSSRSPRTWAWCRPGPAILDGLRAQCNANGALLVFDEVITGFRVGPAGMQGITGIAPDLSIFGKVVGGGLPLAAVGGRADVMDHLAPVGPGVPSRHAVGEPARDRGRPRRARAARRRLPTPRSKRRRRTSPTACATRSPRRHRAGHTRAHARRRVLRAVACVRTTTRPRPPTTSATRAGSTGCSTVVSTWHRAATRRCSRASPTPMPTSSGPSKPPPRPTPDRALSSRRRRMRSM